MNKTVTTEAACTRRVLRRHKRHVRLQILAEALWLSMILDEVPSLQISANLENILSFLNFWSQNKFFCPTRSATLRALTIGRSSGGKIDIYGFFMKIYACSGMAEIFYQVLSGLKGQKHLQNGLSATFCTHRKKCWDIEVMEGKVTSKSINSTWVGN